MVARVLSLVACGCLLSGIGAAGEIDPNLIGWWRFEEGSGTIAVDSSGHGNHGTLMGDPQWVAGYDGLALDLDGQGDYIETGKAPAELGLGGNASRTVALWAYTRSFDGGGLYEMGGRVGREGFALRTGTDDNQWRVVHGGGGSSFTTESAREWFHFTHVNDAYDPLLYVNGERVMRRFYALETTDEVSFRIGVCEDTHFDGLIDDVRLYNRTVGEAEIAEVMRADPLRAWAPQPGHVSTPTLDDTSALGWSAGGNGVAHDIYLGTDRDAVSEATPETTGVYRGRMSGEASSYVPDEAPLEWDTTYYWRIDEVDEAGSITRGVIWRFTTRDYLIVDDFESYDYEDNLIYETWMDGFYNETGSLVGLYETDTWMLIRSGEGCLPFNYDNRLAPRYSEAYRFWEAPQDWTRYGVDTLTLYYHGGPLREPEATTGIAGAGANLIRPNFVPGPHINDPERLYVGLVDEDVNVHVVVHPDREAVGALEWQRWDMPLSVFAAGGVDVTRVQLMILGAGDRENPTKAGEGLVYFDDIRLTRSDRAAEANTVD